ncbi:EamA-like transporter family protein [Loktanella sp. PT4BL]|jgi:drug/metabolite transporter (DMT)-like permease|uniref:EamA-like transporter family protein n=1 Tax=Yoonia vestfoldensis TaxID=245188 RepID=A0A1Y0EFT1_9RHOB|nr:MULTISPECIES: DMT family transporter [Rhodobacterales]ARU02496.1 EamA-like transporter family protein [Yoonia vestfoldensis]PXW66289.1 EamA-like transporter family protein [Loktanella sp. PT4BL]
MTSHSKGVLITIFGVLLVVPDALFVRLIEADPLVTAFWRGLIAGFIIFALVLVFQGWGAFLAALRTGRIGLVYVLLLGTTNIGFVLAIAWTSVANVVFILAAMPIFATIFSRIFLGEPICLRMVVTMAAVMGGLAIIAAGSHENDVSSWQGDLCALLVCASYAGALTAVRCVKDVSMIPAIPCAYLGTALILGLISIPGPDFGPQWPLFLAHGAFIGAASCLLTLGPRYIKSGEVSLLILLESILAPLLVWLVVGENPGQKALLGGVIVISALVLYNIHSIRSSQER